MPALGQLARQRQRLGDVRLRLVKCRVETRDLRNMRCRFGMIALIGARLCGWCSGASGESSSRRLQDLSVDARWRSELRSTVNDPMANPSTASPPSKSNRGLKDGLRRRGVIDLLRVPFLLDKRAALGVFAPLSAARRRSFRLWPRKSSDCPSSSSKMANLMLDEPAFMTAMLVGHAL